MSDEIFNRINLANVDGGIFIGRSGTLVTITLKCVDAYEAVNLAEQISETLENGESLVIQADD